MDELNGEIIWKKTYRYGNGWDMGFGICKTDDGYLMVGVASKGIYWYGWKVWVIKTDEKGNEIWNRVYGSIVDYAYIYQKYL